MGSPPDEPPGAPDPRALGHFRILSELGRGGMGVVHEAWDDKLHRRVAVKVLPEEVARDPKRRERFLREARAAAAVSHPAIATVFQIEEWEGRLAIVMELAEGESLRRRLRGGALPTAEVLEIATAVASALAAAHKAGIAHRDLKPENVMVGESAIKLLDFGIAKALGATDLGGSTGGDLTHTGQVIGTAGYMAPEQASGGEVDQRADVFAFGVMTFEMLSGVLPFDGPTALARAVAVARDAPRELGPLAPDAPPALVALVMRCLEKEPDCRPATGAEILARLPGNEGAARPPHGSPRRDLEPATDPHAATEEAPAPRIAPASTALPSSATTEETEPFRRRDRGTTLGIVAIGVVGFIVLAWMVRSEDPPARQTVAVSSVASVASRSASAAPSSPPAISAEPGPNDAATALPCGSKDEPPIPGSKCSTRDVDWCDADWQHLACCAPGLVPIGSDGACACPPGGTLAADPPTPGCPPPTSDVPIDPSAEEAAFRSAAPRLMACYEKDRAARPDLAGTVQVVVRIAPNGRVFSTRIASSSFPASSAQGCALDVIRQLVFPPPRGSNGARTTAPIQFSDVGHAGPGPAPPSSR